MLFISKQSFKELSECAQSASDSVLGQEGIRSTSPTLRSVLIPFSAEYSYQPRAKHSATDTVAQGKEREKTSTADERVYPCHDNKGRRIEQDRAEEMR